MGAQLWSKFGYETHVYPRNYQGTPVLEAARHGEERKEGADPENTLIPTGTD